MVIGNLLLAAALAAAPDPCAELLRDVRTIDAEGLPGGFICVSTNAFGVVAAKNWDGTVLPVVAGSCAGKGRVLAFGHSTFVESLPFKGDTERLLVNAAAWLAQGKRGKVAAYRASGFANGLRAAGIDVAETDSLSAALKHPVVAAPAGVFATEEDRKRVRDYVAKGGGLLTSAIGWGWKNIAKNHSGQSCLALDYDDQKLLAPLGLIATDLGVARTEGDGGGFAAAFPFPPGATLPEALALSAKEPKGIRDETLRRQVAKTLTMAADAYPPDDSAAYRAFCAFARRPDAKKSPSPETPVTSADFAARIRIVLKKNAWLANPVKKWAADPGAKVYPGLVKKGAKPAKNAEVAVDTSERRWHSTGLFANAGEPVTIQVPAKAIALGLQVRVGTTDDEITSAQETWIRFPVVSVTIPLTKPTLTFASPFGGLVYFVVPFGAPKGEVVKFKVSGAYPAPHFRRGRDTSATWKKQVASARAPQAEIEGERMVITVPSVALASLKDPEWVAKFWDDANELDRALAGDAEPLDYKQRICADTQLTSGFLHNGYPMMCHVSPNGSSEIYDAALIRKKGCWGVLHELGHNHQSAAWTFAAATEVTVNIFTLCCTEKLLGLKPRDAFGEWTSKSGCDRRVADWVAAGKPFETWGQQPFLGLETFTRLREVYGWELFERLFATYRRTGETLPTTDPEKVDQWATRLSELYRANFADYFVAWSWPVSSAARAACAKYPKLTDKRLFRGL